MEIRSIPPMVQTPVGAGPNKPEWLDERREVVRAVKAINNAQLFGTDRELTFAFDRSLQRSIVRIIDRETGEVVQQIPSEQALRIARDIQED